MLRGSGDPEKGGFSMFQFMYERPCSERLSPVYMPSFRSAGHKEIQFTLYEHEEPIGFYGSILPVESEDYPCFGSFGIIVKVK